ncbi:MAG: hypothetical protein ACLP1X_28595 [Polyangiaceae bacterium]
MAKLIILSIVLVSFGVPVWLSDSTQPRRTLRRVQGILLGLIVVWAYLCLHWYPRIVPLQ